MLVEAVDEAELIDDLGADEERAGNAHKPADGVIGRVALQDAPGQHKPGRFAAYLAAADAAVKDIAQVANGEDVLGDADVGQLVADHTLDENDLDLLQMVLDALALGRRQTFV